MVNKGVRGRTCKVIHRYAMINNKYMIEVQNMIGVHNCHTSCIAISATCMDLQRHKNCQLMVLNGEKTSLALMRNSYSTMMKTVWIHAQSCFQGALRVTQ